MKGKRIEGLRVSESFVNATEGYRFGDSEVYEPYTDNVAQLFRSMQKEYGRCESAVYVDTPNGAQRIGWVFSKRMEYEDSGRYGRKRQFYTREVWVTLHTAKPETTTTYHYASL
jgi:hypothetical protein